MLRQAGRGASTGATLIFDVVLVRVVELVIAGEMVEAKLRFARSISARMEARGSWAGSEVEVGSGARSRSANRRSSSAASASASEEELGECAEEEPVVVVVVVVVVVGWERGREALTAQPSSGVGLTI
ncbi:hypothetical protein LX76_04067 [Cereibacter changlensis]|uniref:Uncharacterized protein n=1 Tax=Cereibacter changlensis TaxID=402884 RepID=A0A2W7QNF6_9RHOB|nr:hypothetical protein LX76_04067 [Cereibacter changlensis]